MKKQFFCLKRGQLFTADLLVAVAVVVLVIGVSLHVSEALVNAVFKQSDLSSSAPEALAKGFVSNEPFHMNYSRYCLHYSNGTGNCTGIFCPSGNILGSRRLVNCSNSSFDNTCLLEVRTCASRE